MNHPHVEAVMEVARIQILLTEAYADHYALQLSNDASRLLKLGNLNSTIDELKERLRKATDKAIDTLAAPGGRSSLVPDTIYIPASRITRKRALIQT